MSQQTASVAQSPVERQRAFVQTVQADGRLDRLDEWVHPAIVDHARPDGAPEGIEGVRAVLGMLRAAFPDHDARVLHMVGEGDVVATHKELTGTHLGDFLGVPATGRRATIRVMDVVRYDGGLIVEHWNVINVAGLMAQLGAA